MHTVAGLDDRVRVYGLNATLHTTDNRARLTVGRQFSTALSSVSLFDGAQLDGQRGRFGAGAFAGTQPGVTDLGWSSAVREAGAFVQLRQRALAAHRWYVTLGGITSTDQGQINRDHFVLEGSLTAARASAFVTQEVDWNRGWRAAGARTLSPTSTFAVVRAQVVRDLALDAGYDDRSSVRLYRDRITPLTDFDDRHRQGFWAGASAGLDAPLGALASLELSGGVRTERNALDPTLDSHSAWLGLDGDLHVARRLYLLVSTESDHGGVTSYDQQYVSLSYRF